VDYLDYEGHLVFNSDGFKEGADGLEKRKISNLKKRLIKRCDSPFLA
jgi:hypothetical protein